MALGYWKSIVEEYAVSLDVVELASVGFGAVCGRCGSLRPCVAVIWAAVKRIRKNDIVAAFLVLEVKIVLLQ